MHTILILIVFMLGGCAPGTWSDNGRDICSEVTINVQDNTSEVRVYISPDFLVEVGDNDQQSDGESSMAVNPTLSVPIK